jgi:cyclase
MLAKRIIACLDIRDGRVVKGVNFAGLRNAGDPVELAARYNDEGVDELVVLDVTATLEKRRALHDTISSIAGQLFIPLAVGGGVRSEDDARALIDAGADKISVNTAALRSPALISSLAARYGSQAVIVAIDARRADSDSDEGVGTRRASARRDDFPGSRRASARRYEVLSRSATAIETRDAVSWAREAADRGAGEILLTSIDRDGTKAGFDCDLTAEVSAAVPIPVIASGGAGELSHFADVFTAGKADAALAASIFHFAEHSVRGLKAYLAGRGISVRMVA